MRRMTTILTATLLLLPGIALAQGGLREVPDSTPPYRGVYGGLTFSVGVPTGEFGRNVNASPGFDGHLVIPFALSGDLGIRVQLGALIYGKQSKQIPLSGTGGLVQVKLTTENWLAFFGGGLQYARRRGYIRPYVNGTIGTSYLFTTTGVSGSNDQGDFATTTNLDDAVFSATAGGGVFILFRKGTHGGLDLGAQFHSGGRAAYLTRSGIIDNGDGTTTLNPSSSRTDFWRLYLGLEFGI